jgi:hypothetical protein
MRNAMRMVNAYSKLSLPEQPMLLMEFHRLTRQCERAGRDGARDRR